MPAEDLALLATSFVAWVSAAIISALLWGFASEGRSGRPVEEELHKLPSTDLPFAVSNRPTNFACAITKHFPAQN